MHSPNLVRLRYTAFIAIYPMGLLTELLCIWRAIPLVAKSGRMSMVLPNALNMSFSYATILRAILVIQPMAWLTIYRTLLRQRARKLQPHVRPAASAPSGVGIELPSATPAKVAHVRLFVRTVSAKKRAAAQCPAEDAGIAAFMANCDKDLLPHMDKPTRLRDCSVLQSQE